MILSCMIFLFTLVLQIRCDFFFLPPLYMRKEMEEDNIAVSLCILIIIASAVLRIRLDRRPPRLWARSWIRSRARYCAHHSWIKELSSEDPELSSEDPTGNRHPYFKLFLCRPWRFYTFNFITSKDCYERNMCNLAPVFLGKTLTSVTYKLIG